MKYLIMKCEPLSDQWETDAHRTPLTMVDDWKKWQKEFKPKYFYEIYEFTKNNNFKLIKEWED